MKKETQEAPSAKGTWKLSIPGYREDQTTCQIYNFYTNGDVVFIEAGEPEGGRALLRIRMRFPANIANKMYFYGEDGTPAPPLLSVLRGSTSMSYISKSREGHITFEDFNYANGTLRAKANFSFIDHEHPEKKVYQAIMEVDAEGMIEK
ncbi:hypothetical protein [Pseudomonas sp. MYb118]|uniref:hypothetical protein n=1 Tax=Pseudomonas sp. MYb118 TaxID=1848720 RepID=UPI0034D015F4